MVQRTVKITLISDLSIQEIINITGSCTAVRQVMAFRAQRVKFIILWFIKYYIVWLYDLMFQDIRYTVTKEL